MIQLIIFCIFLCLAGYECSACEINKLACDIVCQQDGDQKGVIIDGKCGCRNQRDISAVPFKVKR